MRRWHELISPGNTPRGRSTPKFAFRGPPRQLSAGENFNKTSYEWPNTLLYMKARHGEESTKERDRQRGASGREIGPRDERGIIREDLIEKRMKRLPKAPVAREREPVVREDSGL